MFAKFTDRNFSHVVSKFNRERHQLMKNARRCAAPALIFAILLFSVPPVIAAIVAREVAAHLLSAVSDTKSQLAGWINSAHSRISSSPQQNKGMPATPVNPPPVGPQRQRSRVEHEARVASLRLNTGTDVLLKSRQRILFAALPLDAEGTPVHGLHAEWDSSNRQVIQVARSGEAIGGRPGTATLTVRAGRVRQTVSVTVIEGGLDQFGGQPREDSQTPRHSSKNSGQPKANLAVAKTGTKRQHGKSGGGAVSAALLKAGAPPVPQHGPADNPLPDNLTSSLYSGVNGVGAPPGKTVAGAGRHAAATEGTENPGAENFSFSIPAFGLAGRGVDAALDLVHNSQLWNKSSDGLYTYMNYDVDSGWPAPGWRLGFGQIENQGGYGMTLTDPDGTRHALIFYANYNADTNDGTFIHFTGTSGSGTVYYSNGTQVEYGAGGSAGLRLYPTKITDNNGNYILISYVSGVGPRISSIEDTLRRHVTFYYAANGDLVTIKAPGLNGQDRVVMRLYYSPVSITTSGLFASNITLGQGIPSSVRAISHIYLPNSVEANDAHIGYSFDYTSYGMMYRAQQFRGMSATWSSDTDAGQPPSGGIQAAVTMYNYEGGTLSDRSIPSGGLSDTPSYTKRTDDWAGRTSGMPGTGTPGDAPYYQFLVNRTNGTSTVTAPDGSVNETDTIIDPGQWDDGLVSDAYIDKMPSSFLSHSHIDWDPNSTGNPRVSQVLTTDDAGNTKATVLTYTTYNNVSVVSERDFATNGMAGTEFRRTETTYQTSSNYTNRHLLHLPTRMIVYRVSNNTALPAARVDYEYDNYGLNHADLTHRDDIIAHNPAFDPFQQTVETNCHWECWDWEWPHTCYDWEWVCDLYSPYDASTDYRGNVTSVKTYPDVSTADPNNSATYIKHSTTYDIAGNVMTVQADCCQQKSFTYSGAGTNGNHDYAYPIAVTSGSGSMTLTNSATFDYSSGLIGTSTDANNQVTRFYYDGNSLRPAYVQRPSGSTTHYYYGDGLQGSGGTNGLHYFTNIATQLDANRFVDSYRFYDGRGAVTQTFDNYAYDSQLFSFNWSTEDIEYDVVGRAYRVSNPYYSGGYGWQNINPTGLWTTKSFDHLGRVTGMTMPSGDDTNPTTTSISASYSGVLTTVTDQAGRQRRQKVDSLGRVIRMDEPNSSGAFDLNGTPAQPTSYEYDTLDNLIHVSQPGPNSITQNRYFKYDSLSRLTYERQVEQSAPWTTSEYVAGNNAWSRKFVYNASGLVTDVYDARQIHTSVVYDGLNRVKTISYSDSTPTAHYYYDSASGLPGGAPSSSPPDSYSPGYSNGKLVAMTYGSTATGTYFSYNNMGRVTSQWQLNGSTPAKYKLSYAYNLGGLLTNETYPSGRALSYGYDDGARLSQVSDASITFSNSFAYAPHFGLTSETFGNTAVHTMKYNHALQASQVKLSINGSEKQRYDYWYGTVTQSSGTVDTSKNNGQIGRIDATINGSSTKEWDQRFVYDELGRLSIAAEYRQGIGGTPTWQTKYTYDRWGNRFQSGNSDNFGIGFTPVLSTDVDAATNRFVSSGSTPVTYDGGNAGNGNVTNDSRFRGQTYTYDANNRQTSTSNGTWTETQVYDCAGRRVQTSVSGTTRTMVYDIFGQDVADYTGNNGSTLERENIYRGGQLIAAYQASNSAIKYVLKDIEGSSRAVMDNSGISSSVTTRHDYLPFGEEIGSGVGLRSGEQGYGVNDTSRQKYAMLERDDTSGLDHTWFRKYDSLGGRWTTPDPDRGSMIIGDPQSFNRYSYVQNNPVNLVDPSGLHWELAHCHILIDQWGDPVRDDYGNMMHQCELWWVPDGPYRGVDPEPGGGQQGQEQQRRCPVDPLTEITDPAAQHFEQGGGNQIDTADLTQGTSNALDCFRGQVTSGGGAFTLNSAYRPPAYQTHLREVWDKWQQLRNNKSPECSETRRAVQAEMSRHGITERPAGPGGPHTQGIAFDASVSLPSGQNMNDLLQRCPGLTQPRPGERSGHHFEFQQP